jgi:hypothetical protein
MKPQNNLIAVLFLLMFVSGIFTTCKDDTKDIPPGTIDMPLDDIDFGDIDAGTPSDEVLIRIKGEDVYNEVQIKTAGDFEFSVNYGDFVSSAVVKAEDINRGIYIKIRCNPSTDGELKGTLTVTGENIDDISVNLSATALKYIKVEAFKDQRLAYGNGYSQSEITTVNFPNTQENTKQIKMYVKLRCPDGGCNAWDMYANIRVKDPVTDEWWEIGRYITPYGVDNSQLNKGFEIDVTDFKSLLTGSVELKAFIEVWGADGWLLSVNFEILEGEPEYKYYAIAPILQYNNLSLAGIPYGVDNSFDVDKCIAMPSNAEQTCLRTIITGWGHATPKDPDGRPCAEWCFRTHHILIDDAPVFTHEMKGIGCANNPVSPQNGNWSPDRAGWCPGMAVPVRIDTFDTSMSGASFCYKYELEQWTNDLQNGKAYYAISSFIVVKSNSPVERPVVE